MSAFLGIHDGHNASAALLVDGRLELALQEERLTRIKNQGDAPQGAAALALQRARELGANHGFGENDIKLALNGLYMNYGQWSRAAIVADYDRSAGLAGRGKQRSKIPSSTAPTSGARRRRGGNTCARPAWAGARWLRSSTTRPTPPRRITHHLGLGLGVEARRPRGFWCLPATEPATGCGDRVHRGARQARTHRRSERHDSIGRLYALVTRRRGWLRWNTNTR